MLDNTFPHLCRKRTLLCRPLSRSLGNHTSFPPHLRLPSPVGGPYLAGGRCSHLFPCLRIEKYYQRRPAVEGFQDPGWSGFGREGKGEGGGEGHQGLRPRVGLSKRLFLFLHFCSFSCSLDSSFCMSNFRTLPSDLIIMSRGYVHPSIQERIDQVPPYLIGIGTSRSVVHRIHHHHLFFGSVFTAAPLRSPLPRCSSSGVIDRIYDALVSCSISNWVYGRPPTHCSHRKSWIEPHLWGLPVHRILGSLS